MLQMILICFTIRVTNQNECREDGKMYVCVCNAVTERQIRQAINEGARTTGQVRQKLDAGRVCGSCDDCLEDYLAEAFMFVSPGLRTATVE